MRGAWQGALLATLAIAGVGWRTDGAPGHVRPVLAHGPRAVHMGTAGPVGASPLGGILDESLAATGRVSRFTLADHTGGALLSVASDDGRALVAVGAELVVLDTSDPADIRVRGRQLLPSLVWAAALAGAHAYAATASDGLQVLSTSGAIHREGALALGGEAWDLALAGDRLVIALDDSAQTSSLRIVDVSDPLRPRELGRLAFGRLIAGMAASADCAYIVAGSSLVVISLTGAGWPREVGRLDGLGEVTDVAVAGDRAVVVDNSPGQEGLRVVDTSDPASPRAVGFLATGEECWGAELRGDRAFVLDTRGTRIVDIAAADHPVAMGRYDTSASPRRQASDADRLYVIAESGAMTILDMTDPSAPTQVASWWAPGAPTDVVVSDGLALQVEGVYASGLTILDVTHPDVTRPVAHIGTAGQSWRVALAGDTALVADWQGGLTLVDVGDPANPRRLTSWTAPGAVRDVVATGRLALLAADSAGLQVVDISDPEAPTAIGDLSLPSPAWGVAADGTLAVVATRTELWAIDVSDPSAPRALGSVAVAANGGSVYAASPYAYAATDDGLEIVSVGFGRAPSLVAAVALEGGANGVAVRDGLAYVAGRRGLRRVDVSDPLAPVAIRGLFSTAAPAYAVTATGELAYVAAYEAGLYVVRSDTGWEALLPLTSCH